MDFLGLFCVIAAVNYQLNVALSPIVFRWADNERVIDPRELCLAIIGCAAFVNLVLSLLFRCQSIKCFQTPQLWKNIIFSIFGGAVLALSQFLCLMSLEFASTKVAAIATLVTPFVIHVLNLIRRKEKLSIKKLIGFFIASVVPILVRIFMYHDPIRVHPTSSNWDVLWGFLLCLASSIQLQAWVTNYIEDKMEPSCGDSFAVKTMICIFGAIFIGALYLILPNHGVGNGNTKPHEPKMLRVILMIAINSVMQAGAIWCVQRKGKSYLAAFSLIPPFASTVGAPFISESRLYLVGMIVTCSFILIGGLLVKMNMEEEEEASQETYVSSGNHQGEGMIIDLLESQQPQLNTVVTTVDDEPQRIQTFIYQQGETSLHHPESIDLESSNTVMESVIDIVDDTDDQDEEINHGDEGGGIEGTGMDNGNVALVLGLGQREVISEPGPSNTVEESALKIAGTDDQGEEINRDDQGGGVEGTRMDSGYGRGLEPCEATSELGASNTVEESATDDEDEEINHDDEGGGIEGTGIDSGHDGGGLRSHEVT